jgi:hypothetical protein
MTKQELRSRYNSYISHETIGNDEYNILLEWMKLNDGKAINKRLKLPENFKLDFSYGMFHMVNTNTQFSHLIGYNSNPVIDSKKFVDYDACYGYAALERIEKCKFILANQIDLLLNQYNEMQENWNNFYTTQQAMHNDKNLGWVNNPIYHNLMKSFLPEQIYKAL